MDIARRHLMNKVKPVRQKWLASITFVLIILLSVSQSMANNLLTTGEKEWLAKHKEIRVGAFNDYPPFGFIAADGQAQGMSVDFWNLMATKLGIKIKFYPTAFAQQLKGLKNNKLDSLAGIFPLEERKKYFDFTKEYTVIATRIFVRSKYVDLKGIDDLKGLNVGGVEGDSGKAIAEKAGLTTKGFASYISAIQALDREDIDAIIMDELVVNHYKVQNNLEGKIHNIGDPVDQGNMTLPVAKGNTVLLSILNKGVSMVSSDEWLKIRQKWIGR
jgi:ABC-type amino acid transport substrate-binding protein